MHCDCERTRDAGTIIHTGNCPLAEVFTEQFGADAALVGHTEIFLIKGDVTERYLTPPELLSLILRFEETGELLLSVSCSRPTNKAQA